MKYVNYHGYLNGTSNVSADDYIAVLHSAAIDGNYKLTKAVLSDGIWTATTASDDDIKVFSSLTSDFENSSLMFAMKDASSGYIMKTKDTEKLDLSMSYENSLLLAEAEKATTAKFSPDGCVEIEGVKTDYSLGMTFNSDYPTDWYTIKVSGSGANKASLEKVKNGWIVSADKLNNIKVNANNDSVKASTGFSTKYQKAFIYEIDEHTIGVRVDTDGNGTYETDIADVSGNDGDANGDGKVNMKDLVLLQRHLNGWAVDIDLTVCDLTGDGKVNMKDYVALQRKLNGWDIAIA